MSEKINEMEKICLASEENELSQSDFDNLKTQNSEVHDAFIRYYTLLEDIVFPELEKVLPSPTSTTSMRNEHAEILRLNTTIGELFRESENAGKNKQEIISNVFSFVDIFQRHIHKKNNVMYHEVSSFISEETQGDIYRKILKVHHK